MIGNFIFKLALASCGCISLQANQVSHNIHVCPKMWTLYHCILLEMCVKLSELACELLSYGLEAYKHY